MTSFSADNASVNFGSSALGGKKNVFYRLKTKNLDLFPVKCPCHILHNAARISADQLGVDLEAILLKTAAFFRSSTIRTERLKSICEDLEVISVKYLN